MWKEGIVILSRSVLHLIREPEIWSNIQVLINPLFRYGSSEVRQVEITEKDLLDKAKEINVVNLQPFYNSSIFKVIIEIVFSR